MPTISMFFGIVVQMYWRDHPPPHFHAHYQGFEALVSIDTGEVIAGELPAAIRRVLKGWTQDRRAELMANWERARLMQRLEAIPGADAE